MTNFTAPNYEQDATRLVAEMKIAFEQNLAATKEMLGGLPIATITMSGTSITPAAGSSAFLAVATPGGASSANLTNCVPTNIKPGAWIALTMANAGQVVVVKHAAGGAGQYSLVGSADLTLADPTVVLILALSASGAIWTEVGRFYGAQGTAFRNFYQLAGLGQNRFTGRQEFNRGAAISSAAALAIGTDGNYFLVTGTTTITSIASAPAGTRIALQFGSDGCVVVSTPGVINLQGGNYRSRAGDVLEFISEGAGAWREVGAGRTSTLDLVYADQTVANTITAATVYSYSVPGNVLGINRALRLTVPFTWRFGQVQTFGARTVYGTRFRLYYGATLIADSFMPGGLWDNAAGIGYVYSQTAAMGMTLTGTVSAQGAPNAQLGTLALNAPFATSAFITAGWNGPQNAIRDFGLVLGQLASDVNGVPTPGVGTAAEDSTAAKLLQLTVEHNYADPSNVFQLLGATLELL